MEVLSEFTVPGREARHEAPPKWLKNSPAWTTIRKELTCDELYRHQSIALDLLGQGKNVVVSTDTASGKSLIFQAFTLHQILTDDGATAIAIYPRKSLARDQHNRWRRMGRDLGLDPNAISVINGDVPVPERTGLLEQSRLCLMTPDVMQAWLMGYSDARQTRNDAVNRTKDVVRNFLAGLSVLIIDEAHYYSAGIGTHVQYLLPRLFHKQRKLNPGRPHPRIIAASATIASPAEHLKKLTGKTFVNVSDSENGAPKAPLTVQHVRGRPIGERGWEDMADAIREALDSDPKASYIAFVDNRQLAERTAAKIEPAQGILETEIVDEAELSLSYRGGLMFRERIEDKLWRGAIRGIVSTSAMEMGIDVPDLTLGLNLGAPTSMRSLKQRAGRVGRRNPARFVIIAPEDAFADHENSIEAYWSQDPESPPIYNDNPYIKLLHAQSMLVENDYQVQPLRLDEPDPNDPEGEVAETIKQLVQSEKSGDPAMMPANRQFPHKSGFPNGSDVPTSIEVKRGPEGPHELLTDHQQRGDAIREAYPLATYWHQKQSYTIESWRESTDQYQNRSITIQCRQDRPRETRPLKSTRVAVRFPTHRTTDLGRLQYSRQSNTNVSETVYGCESTDPETGKTETLLYADREIEPVRTEHSTTATTVVIWESWFDDPDTRATVAAALKHALCRLEGIRPGDIGTAFEDIFITSNSVEREAQRAIVVYDTNRGSLGLCRALAERFLEYTEHILKLAQDAEGKDERTHHIDARTARLLHDWARRMDGVDALNPVVSEYAGVLFRSLLEAEWVERLDRLNIEWEYEPEPLPGWLPDFHITTRGGYQALVEVKPSATLPEDQVRRIDQSGYTGNAIILGKTGDYKWSRNGGPWTPLGAFPP